MLYELEVDNNVAEAAKNMCYTKDEATIDHSHQLVEDILLTFQEDWLSVNIT